MRAKVAAVQVPDGLTVIDTCGTGGDAASTFNISTAAALVAAAAGRPHGVAVAKHGNRSVTSRSGSSQVLETLGVRLKVAPQTLTRCLDEAGLCFCFAPMHHPAMRHAVPIRQSLGVRTIFNVLGPLTNPAGARRQVMGVFAPELTETLATVLGELGSEDAMVVCGRLGEAGRLDELSTGGPTRVSRLRNGGVQTSEVDPASLGLAPPPPGALQVDGPEASAAVVREVLEGRPGPARDIVVLNAAAALVVAGLAADLSAGLERAGQAIDAGEARQALDRLVAITNADDTPQ
jgi:anthranilate phosphoribosyltransferase